MERIRSTVHTLRQQPTHVRERIAFGASVGITGLIGLVWAVSLASSGVLAVNGTRSDAPAELASQDVGGSVSELMGAVGALTGATTSAPALTIVDGPSASTYDAPVAPPPSATVIPF